MQEQIFIYKGKDLIGPLTTLVETLSGSLKQLDQDLLNYKAAKPKTPRVASFAEDPYKNQMSEIERSKLAQEADLKKANNWLRECLRTPKREFKVDLQDLNWLYR